MGRRSKQKERIDDPARKLEWIKFLTPQLEQHGLANLTMDDVAAMLKISKATLYKYFESRDEILDLALDLKLSYIREFENKLHNYDLPYLERYFQATQVLMMNLAGVSNAFLSDLKTGFPEVWKKIDDFIDYATNVLQDYYQEGIEDGYLKTIEPSILVLSDKLFFTALSDPDFLVEHNISIQKAFTDYFRLKLEGVIKNDKRENLEKEIENFVADIFEP